MTGDSALRAHLPGLLLLFAFLISLLFFLVFPPERIRRTLFFPGTTNLALRGETRLLPRAESPERDIELLVEDILLGPADIDHGRIVPRDTKIRALLLDDRTVFIDLSTRVMDEDSSVRLPLDPALAAIEQTLIYNFRTINDVVITIGGQVPYAPAFRESPVGN